MNPPAEVQLFDVKNGGPVRNVRTKCRRGPPKPPAPPPPVKPDWGYPENPGPARAFAYWQAVGEGYVKWWKSTKEARRQRRIMEAA